MSAGVVVPSDWRHVVGRVTVPIQVRNLQDVLAVAQGQLEASSVRSVDVTDALVDTGASTLCLPRSLIATLGLVPISNRTVKTTNGPVETAVYSAVRLSLLGRSCTLDVTDLPEDVPILVGQIPLELLNLIVDPNTRQVIPSPAHGGDDVWEEYLEWHAEMVASKR